MEKKHYIVYSFQSFNDPLFKGLMLRYMEELQKKEQFCFHLITHEQPHLALSHQETAEWKEKLKSENILWYPIKYNNGRFLLFKKAFDFLKSFFICLYIRLRFKTKLIIGFLPIAAGFGALIGKFLNMNLLVYCFEPHSDYMADFGIWDKKGMKYRLLNLYEKIQLEYASFIIVPTRYSLSYIQKKSVRKFVLPISVDTDLFIRNATNADKIRRQFELEGKKVLLYTGKFGGIYYSVSQFIPFLSSLGKTNENFRFMIVSTDKKEIETYISQHSLDRDKFILLDFIPYENLNDYISACDMGIVAVPPLPSQRYRTPVKTGLYLSCGIPYLVNSGIADDDHVAEENNVGVVVENYLNADFSRLNERILKLLNSDDLHNRCRDLAVKTRSTFLAVDVLNEILCNFQKKRF